MGVQNIIKHQHIVFAFGSPFNVRILFVNIIGVEGYGIAVFVCLVGFQFCFVFVCSEMLSFCIFEKDKLPGSFKELIIRNNAVFHKQSDALPFFFECLAVFPEQLGQLFSHFFSNVGIDTLHITVSL
ncbi:hypothetical protein D9M69_583720 [compost metagenome]